MRFEDCAIRIDPLPIDEGGGYLVTVPVSPCCMADGETVVASIAEARDARSRLGRRSSERTKASCRRQRHTAANSCSAYPKSLHQLTRLPRRRASA